MDVDRATASASTSRCRTAPSCRWTPPMYVHNLSAVGEQYLDFEPRGAAEAPYAEAGDTLEGSDDVAAGGRGGPAGRARPVRRRRSTSDSLGDRRSRELGLMFNDTGVPLQKLIDSGGKFIDEAAAARGGDRRAAPERADRAAHPARRGREHPGLLPRPQPDHPQRCAAATRTCAARSRARPATRARSRRCSRTCSRRCRSCSATP